MTSPRERRPRVPYAAVPGGYAQGGAPPPPGEPPRPPRRRRWGPALVATYAVVSFVAVVLLALVNGQLAIALAVTLAVVTVSTLVVARPTAGTAGTADPDLARVPALRRETSRPGRLPLTVLAAAAFLVALVIAIQLISTYGY